MISRIKTASHRYGQEVDRNLITKARLSLTHSLIHSITHSLTHLLTPLSRAAQSKAYSAKKKGLALNNSQSCPNGRVDKATGFRSDGGSTYRFDSQHGWFLTKIFMMIMDWRQKKEDSTGNCSTEKVEKSELGVASYAAIYPPSGSTCFTFSYD